MVDKKHIVEYLTFADVHETLNDEDSEEFYDTFFNTKEDGTDFSQPDYILLHGGPDTKEEYQRFSAFEDLMQVTENDKLPYLITTPSYKNKIDNSSKVTENDFIYVKMEPESTHEELEKLSERIKPGETAISITNDYHVPRTESLMNSMIEEDNEYLVIGAEYDFRETEYGDKWRSELVRTVIPQNIKDLGKKLL